MPVTPRERGAKLICGCGYLGERVARRWVSQGHEVVATTRSVDRAAELRQLGIRPQVVDITRPFVFPDPLPPIDTVLFAVGFDRSSGQSIREVYAGGLTNLLDALPPSIGRIVYISSTGVYGDATGEWVDESTPCQPRRAGGQACLEAEQILQQHPLGTRGIVLRLAGIYGPGRVPKMSAVRAGEPVESPELGWLNLIYVDDAVSAVLAAEQLRQTPECFNVSDGHPVLRGDFYRELARLLHAPEPRFVSPTPGTGAAERAGSDKRISNARIRQRLQFVPQFPTYREGLRAIASLAAED